MVSQTHATWSVSGTPFIQGGTLLRMELLNAVSTLVTLTNPLLLTESKFLANCTTYAKRLKSTLVIAPFDNSKASFVSSFEIWSLNKYRDQTEFASVGDIFKNQNPKLSLQVRFSMSILRRVVSNVESTHSGAEVLVWTNRLDLLSCTIFDVEMTTKVSTVTCTASSVSMRLYHSGTPTASLKV